MKYFIYILCILFNAESNCQDKLAPGEFNPNVDAGLYIGTPLATNLLEFNVQSNDCKVRLQWVLSSSAEALSFDVLRKNRDKGTQFETIAHIPAKAVVTTYDYLDLTAFSGDYEYQLVIHDMDGKSTISSIEHVLLDCTSEIDVQVFPNPVQDQVTILLPFRDELSYTIQIHDVSGRILFADVYTPTENMLVKIPVQSWSSGVYQVSVTPEGEQPKVFRVC